MDATQIILLVFILLLVIAYPILISQRNKKENQKLTEQTNSLKRGDKVLTTSGVYGTIVDLHLDNDRKIVTIETGSDKKKGYLSIDAYAIYSVITEEKDEPKIESAKVEDKKEISAMNEDKKEEKKDAVVAEKVEEKKEVEKASTPEKKTRKKKESAK